MEKTVDEKDIVLDSDLQGELELPDELDVVDEARVNKAIEDLSADSRRCDGVLQRTDIERLYFKRQIPPNECVHIEKCLVNSGIKIHENDDELDESQLKDSPKIVLDLIKQSRSATFINEIEERQLGRSIQIYLQAENQQLNGTPIDATVLAQLKERSDTAIRRLILSNLRYVAHVANKRRVYGNFDLQDMVQEGILGLMKATKKFDPEMGFRFKTYATWWIRQSMDRALKDKSRTIRIPVHVFEKIKKIKSMQASLIAQFGSEPSYQMLGEALGMPAERVAEYLWHANASEVKSIDDDLSEDFNFADTIKDEHASDPHKNAEDRELHEMIAKALHTLKPREERILRMRFGIDLPGSLTLEAIGQEYSMTRERIRQIEEQALAKLLRRARINKLGDHLDKK